MNDKELVELFTARSQTAIEETDALYGGYLHTLAHRILPCEEDVAECVNDTYLRAWNAIPPAMPQSLRAYLAKIVRRLAFDRYKSDHADKRGGGQLPLILDELSECVANGNEATQVTETIALKDCLNHFLDDLPATKRWIFLRRYWYGDSIEEIARRVHKSENAVRVTLSRLRTSLKDLLEKEGIAL